MKSSAIIIATTAILLGVSLYAGISQSQYTEIPQEVVTQFQEWKRSQNKLYRSPSEDHYRLSVFYKNLRMINAHNAGGHSYTLAINRFADLTLEEFKVKYTGGLVPPAETAREDISLSTEGLPASIDWTTRGAVTAVKDQVTPNHCQACSAFATTGALEGLKAISGRGLTSMSEQQLLDCTTNMGNFGCRGGYPHIDFKYVSKAGIEAESSYPYQGVVGTCKHNPSKSIFKISSFSYVPYLDNDALQAAVATQPVSVLIDASHLLYYSGGIVSSGCTQTIDHAVLAVGYGTDGGKMYWKLKNSWGTNWGENGYLRLIRKTGRGRTPCGINEYATRPIL